MSIDSISDVLTRITSIEQQLQQVSDGSVLDGELGISGSAGSGTTASTSTSSSTDFANQLAAAQEADPTSATASTLPTDTALATNSALPSGSGTFGALADSALGSTAGVALPTSGSAQLTSSQQQFASTLSADTGLNPGVVTAWLLAEESGSAAQSRQAGGNNDWLNIGYTDSGTFGAADSVWSDPVSAANATAEWLGGQDSIPGYGAASSGVQGILSSVGQTPAAQIQAIQGSGWSSGGYPSLPSLYGSVVGSSS
jgi:hypothetical protein